MGNAEGRPRRRSHAGRIGVVMLLAMVLGAGLIMAAPAFALVHYSGSDVTKCFDCHSTVFNQWKASSPYPSADGLTGHNVTCLLYTSDAADDLLCVDLGGRRIIKKKK